MRKSLEPWTAGKELAKDLRQALKSGFGSFTIEYVETYEHLSADVLLSWDVVLLDMELCSNVERRALRSLGHLPLDVPISSNT
jgi:hypothetical protein